MSVHVLFALSEGLAKPIRVPKGTYAKILDHVADIERRLDLKNTKVPDQNHWNMWALQEAFDRLKDGDFCAIAREHNRWVHWLYERLAEWSEKPPKTKESENLTPKLAKEFWHALQEFAVPVERWDRDYYVEMMEHAYEVMRRKEHDDEYFDAEPLTSKQADAVINLFGQWLDEHDMRLAVPNGHDCLKSPYDGGYKWCSDCGAVDEGDFEGQIRNCEKEGCDLRSEYGEAEEESEGEG